MNKNNPRWINEIPKPISSDNMRELTEKEKEEAEEFEKAIKNDKIDEWFKK